MGQSSPYRQRLNTCPYLLPPFYLCLHGQHPACLDLWGHYGGRETVLLLCLSVEMQGERTGPSEAVGTGAAVDAQKGGGQEGCQIEIEGAWS